MNRLTGVISSTRDALEMLWWCVDVFQDALNETDGDGSKQGFALIAFAQASASLHAWVCKESSADFHKISEEVTWTREFRAIAEATRHANPTSKYWQGENIPVLRGEPGRVAQLDGLTENEWFEDLVSGLADRSLWFENTLTQGDTAVDARHAILRHAEQWQTKVLELGLG